MPTVPIPPAAGSSSGSSYKGPSALVLEHPLLRVPCERLNLSFRRTQKVAEKEAEKCSAQVKALAKAAGKKPSKAEAIAALKALRKRTAALVKTLGEGRHEEKEMIDIIKARADHVANGQRAYAEVAKGEGRAVVEGWENRRLDALVVDHLLRRGHVDAAGLLAREARVEPLADTDIFRQRGRIVAALRGGSTSEALSWCAENRSRLKKVNSDLEFHLRLQEFVELVRVGETNEAVAYAREHLTPMAEEKPLEIRRAMGALAFGPDSGCVVYEALFNKKNRWSALERRFCRDHAAMHAMTSVPVLAIAVAAGVTVLKRSACTTSARCTPSDGKIGPANMCPVCAPHAREIAKVLPMSLHTQSKLVCRITGKLMDTDNPPLVLPNGMVYSKEAIDAASDSFHRFTCPITNDTFKVSELKKAFVL